MGDGPAASPGSMVDTLEVRRRLADVEILTRLEGLEESPALLNEVLEFIFRHLREILPCDRMSLVVLEGGGQLRLMWARTAAPDAHVDPLMDPLLPEDFSAPVDQTGLGPVIHGRRPRIIDDLAAHYELGLPPDHSRFLLGEGTRSSLACPLTAGNETLGVLFFSSLRPRAYDHRHVHRFELIAQHLSEIVRQGRGHRDALARRSTTEDELRSELSPAAWQRWSARHQASISHLGQALISVVRNSQRTIQELQLLDAITERVNAGLTLDEVLDFVYGSFHAVIPYDRIGFALIEGEGSQSRAVARWCRSAKATTAIPAGYAGHLLGSSLARIVRTGLPRIINDLPAYLLAHPDSDSTRRIVSDGMRSSLTCPLIAMGRPVGFLFFSSLEVSAYAHAHVDSFERIAQRLAVIVEKGRIHQEVVEERERADELLHSILPPLIAARIKAGEEHVADLHESATVLFADLVGFTATARSLEAREVVAFLDRLFSRFDTLAQHHEVEKIKTLGDGYLAVAGVPKARHDHAQAAARLALDMVESLYEVEGPGGARLELRVGLHSGPLVAGVIGRHKFRYDIWGDTVNISSRMEKTAAPGRVLISKATADLLSDDFRLQRHGMVDAKGIGPIETWMIEGPVYA